jgi:hypothetical protein
MEYALTAGRNVVVRAGQIAAHPDIAYEFAECGVPAHPVSGGRPRKHLFPAIGGLGTEMPSEQSS